ncbi:hypothetical protein JD974_12495 [Chromobacterium haemolyticum]|uniref:DUF1640 domain-containing protein n=1 Tax=Chromobacterium haemolyticum TaxID=394935 RepID=A0ABS3GNC8_9NEIS|nr:hypothetical protein [Chromobacterium haemolyticum]MBK0415225.1 hypothetical protein [Chromobacterium haemolyticum]MBO0416560.1 hypothetical protein [Chromobacterium haemolyticum]MBO0499864.1 hypothetical protein [Chromobacterium haemolyticum]
MTAKKIKIIKHDNISPFQRGDKPGSAMTAVKSKTNISLEELAYAYEQSTKTDVVLDAKEDSPHTQTMSTSITREELDAKLAANVAEVRATAADMRAEMAALRAENHVQFAEVKALIQAQTSSFNTLGAKIDGVEKGLEGKIDGLKSSINMLQWVIGFAVAIAGIWVAYMQLKQAETPPPQAAPIVQQAPQLPVVPTQAPPKQK